MDRVLGHCGGGIQQAQEVMEIYGRLSDTIGQANCWNDLAMAFFDDKQLGGARHAAFRAINLVSEEGQDKPSALYTILKAR